MQITHNELAEKLLFPLFRCISDDYKQKYKKEIWEHFENNIISSSYCSNLKEFLQKICNKLPIELQYKYSIQVLEIIESKEDDEILEIIRKECKYLVLLTRILNEERKQQFINE